MTEVDESRSTLHHLTEQTPNLYLVQMTMPSEPDFDLELRSSHGQGRALLRWRVTTDAHGSGLSASASMAQEVGPFDRDVEGPPIIFGRSATEVLTSAFAATPRGYQVVDLRLNHTAAIDAATFETLARSINPLGRIHLPAKPGRL